MVGSIDMDQYLMVHEKDCKNLILYISEQA